MKAFRTYGWILMMIALGSAVQETNGTIRCVCQRCSQDCPTIGRLGDAAAVRRERQVTFGVPAGRWYRR
jgi:hypothetical protein